MASSAAYQVGHFEIPADRTDDDLKSFYSSLFGWQFEKAETEDYWMIKNAGISGGHTKRESWANANHVYWVESIDEYISKAQQLGAKVVKNKQEISEGHYAVMEDPQKNTFGIWRNKK